MTRNERRAQAAAIEQSIAAGWFKDEGGLERARAEIARLVPERPAPVNVDDDGPTMGSLPRHLQRSIERFDRERRVAENPRARKRAQLDKIARRHGSVIVEREKGGVEVATNQPAPKFGGSVARFSPPFIDRRQASGYVFEALERQAAERKLAAENAERASEGKPIIVDQRATAA